MTKPHTSTQSFENRLADFSRALREGLQPTLESFLPEAPERAEVLIELVHAELEYRLKQGHAACVEDYLARYPELAGPPLASLVEAELRLRLRQEPALDIAAEKARRFPQLTLRDTSPTEAGELTPPARSPGFACRYRRQAFHASGGLGVVYRATDEELGRQVALKEIQERHAQDPRLQRRFVFEAEVTGRLEHPAIVPVYGQGRYPDGRPYYAMRFIQGETLAEAIACFHQSATTSQGLAERMARLRALLGRFLTVCQAVAYAHSRGVLHRDIKPANIMLGAFGETFLVDWGLSRASQESEESIRLGPTGPAETRQGAVVGTPAYLSPEQALGQQDQVGPPSDIYSLGATLYQILTGQPPFVGEDAQATVERAARGQFARPRQLKGWNPAALEVVCLKALARRPEDRYAGAQELGAEIDRWLADEPVLAQREPLTVRLRRWGRRHRVLVTGGMVALLVSVVALGVGLAAVGAEQRQTAWERDRALGAEKEARQNLARAEKNLALARQAVGDCFGVAKEHPLLQREEMKEIKKLLLEKALPFYQNFQAQKPNDPGTEEDLADQFFQVGYITTELGRDAEAFAAFCRARDRYQVLVAAQSGVLQHRYNLAATLSHLGSLLEQKGQRTQALRSYQEALDHQRQLVKANRKNDEWEAALSRTLGEIGGLLAINGDRARGVKALREAVAIQHRLAKARPESISHQATLGLGLHALAQLLAAEGQAHAALKLLSEARAIQTRVVERDRTRALYKSNLAETLNVQSVLLADTGRRAETMQTRRETLALLEELVRLQPNHNEHQLDRAGCLCNLADLLKAEGDTEAAAATYRRARDLLRPLVRQQKGVSRFSRYLVTALNNLGTLLTDEDQPTEALEAFREAQGVLEDLHRATPSAPDFRSALARTLTNKGLLLADRKTEEALRSCTRAEGILRELVRDVPAVVEYRHQWAWTLSTLAALRAQQPGKRGEALKLHGQAEDILSGLLAGPAPTNHARATLAAVRERIAVLHANNGDHAPALKAYASVRDLAEVLVKADPTVPAHQHRLAHVSLEMGVLLARGNRLAEARTAWNRGREVGEALVKAHPRRVEYRHDLGRTFYNLGILLAPKEPAEALTAYRQARAHQEQLPQDKHAGPAEFRNALAQTLINMGLLLAVAEKQEALACFTRARAIQKKLVAEHPKHTGYRLDLARACLNCGGSRFRIGQARDARDDLSAAIAQAQAVETQLGRSPDSHKLLMLASYWRAQTLEKMQDYRAALPDWERALALAPAAMRNEPLWGRAQCLARAGEYRRALDEARALAKTTRTGPRWYTLARIAGLSGSSAAGDTRRPSAEREEFATVAAGLAITWLESAERVGYFKPDSARQQLQNDPALAGLRARPAFQQLLARVQNKGD